MEIKPDRSINLDYAKRKIKLNDGEICVSLNRDFIKVAVNGNLNVFYNGEKIIKNKKIIL